MLLVLRIPSPPRLVSTNLCPSPSGCIINSLGQETTSYSRHKMSEHIIFQLRYLSNNLLGTVSPPFALSVTGRLSREVKVKSKKSAYKLLDGTSPSAARRCFPSSAACLCCVAIGVASCFDFPAVLHSLLQAKLKINSVNVLYFCVI